jgi:hypothetical protein
MTTNPDRYAGEKPTAKLPIALKDDRFWDWNPKTQKYTRRANLSWMIYRLFHLRIL